MEKNIRFTDKALLREVKTHKDGYKVIRASVVRTGVQGYLRSELGDAAPVGNPNDVLRIYRAPDEVFSDRARNGWAHVPVTLDHPPELVTPENYAKYAVGEVTAKGSIDPDERWFDMQLIVKDSVAIAAQDTTHTQFSGGYTAGIDFTAGVTPQGEHYDGRQVNIDPNHMALVPMGRAFSDAAISPQQWGVSPVILKDKDNTMEMKPIAIGDAVVNVAITDAPTITKMIADHKAAVEAKDTAIGELKAECAAANAKVLTDAQIEARVADRMTVIDKAKSLVTDYDATGKAVADIKREVVQSVYGADAAGADVSDAEINGIFRVMAPAKVDDSAREAIKNTEKKTVADGCIDWAAAQKKGKK